MAGPSLCAYSEVRLKIRAGFHEWIGKNSLYCVMYLSTRAFRAFNNYLANNVLIVGSIDPSSRVVYGFDYVITYSVFLWHAFCD